MIQTTEVRRDEHDQIDGRFYVYEKHVHEDGHEDVLMYLAEPGTDYEAVADSRATAMKEQELAAQAASRRR